MLETIDIAIVALYAGALVVLAHWVSRKRRAPKRTPKTTFWPANRCPGGQSVPH